MNIKVEALEGRCFRYERATRLCDEAPAFGPTLSDLLDRMQV